MAHQKKYFGIGMSKTGTTTLGQCFEILGLTPHIGFDPQLKKCVESGKNVERVLRSAEHFRSFEDSPWYLIYRELDERFPGSKFILTVRENSLVHARSSWAHGARRGLRVGGPTTEYLQQKIEIYERHNAGVQEYFKDRPNDLLTICWENGDGWEKLCRFLCLPVPGVDIPHANAGRYRSRLPLVIQSALPYRLMQQTVHKAWLSPPVRKVNRILKGWGRSP